MDKLGKNWKRDKIKSDVIKGKQHFAHKSAIRFSKPNRLSILIVLQNKVTIIYWLRIKKIEVFSACNALNSDWEQYLFLKSLVIAIDNENKKNLKFDYYIEVKSQQNEV
jgi:hypothetical protein